MSVLESVCVKCHRVVPEGDTVRVWAARGSDCMGTVIIRPIEHVKTRVLDTGHKDVALKGYLCPGCADAMRLS